jgi:hypothetical protein
MEEIDELLASGYDTEGANALRKFLTTKESIAFRIDLHDVVARRADLESAISFAQATLRAHLPTEAPSGRRSVADAAGDFVNVLAGYL